MAVIFKTDLSEHYLEVGVIGQPEVVYLGRNSDHPYSYWVRCEFPLQLRKICKSVVKLLIRDILGSLCARLRGKQ